MPKSTEYHALKQRKRLISYLFISIVIIMVIFILSVLKTIASDRRIPSHHTTIYDRSLRGKIISLDNYTLSDSQKTYQAIVRAESIEPQKKALFIRLFSIYSGIDEKKLEKTFKNKRGKLRKGNIILSKTITSRFAMQLKSLAYKLRRLKVFRSIKNSKGIRVVYGLDIIENGETRRFPKKDILSPILGYVGKKSEKNYIRPRGKKGLEYYYDKHITSKKNGYFRGKRDVLSAVIHDKNSVSVKRVDGLDLHLNIALAFQRPLEIMIDQMRKSIRASEIIIGVMESKTGKVLGVATTNRYNPAHIRQKDVDNGALVPKFTEYPYEAGSVIKPLSLAVALEHHKVTPNTIFNTYNGKLKIGKRRWISDDEKFDSLSTTDIIVHSSNVGISQIAWRLNGQQFREGFLNFGIAKPSGVDLSRDLPGQLKPRHLLENTMHRANTAYGYGMMVTFAQLFKAYSAFNNDGLAMSPRLVDYLEDKKGNHYTLPTKLPDAQAVSKKTANQIHKILLEVVKRGTGVKAQYKGLNIGGKTGTAHIAEHGRYVRKYHSSFYGFANDDFGHKYTIGVLVIKAKKYHKYFASQSAVPTFRKAVNILVEQNYLKPNLIEIEEERNTLQSNVKPKKRKIYKTKKKPKTKVKKSVNDLFKGL